MSAPDLAPGAADVLKAVADAADDLRRRYRERLDLPTVYVLRPGDYDRLAAAVADGTAPARAAREFARGTYVPAGRLIVDEAL